jgi:hypothetical protein
MGDAHLASPKLRQVLELQPCSAARDDGISYSRCSARTIIAPPLRRRGADIGGGGGGGRAVLGDIATLLRRRG